VLGSFLRAFGLRADQMPLERAARIDRYRDLVRRRRLLVVLDNVARTEDVAALLPTGVGSLAIVTSRTRLTALTSRHGALPVVLDRIDQASALSLLSRFASVRRGRVPEAIEDIARACDGHPLALCLVGARIATRPEEPVTSVAEALTASTRRIPTLDRYAEAGDTVADVFGWSYASLSKEQAYVFRMLGLSVSASLDLPAAASLIGADESAVRPVLAALVDDHLLTVVGSDRYRMLDLLAEYAAALADDTDTLAERTAALDRLYAHHLDRSRAAVHAIWPNEIDPGTSRFGDSATARAWLDEHRVDLLAGALHAGGVVRPQHVIDLSTSLYRYLDHGGHLDQATQLNDAALAAARALGDQLATARALGLGGALLIRLGEAERAEAVLREAEELFAGLGYARGRAVALGNLGRAAARQGRFTDAAARQSEALKLFREIGDRSAEARTLTNLGIVLEARGEWAEALEHHEAARVIAEAENTPDALARALGSIAGVLGAQGRLAEARERYEDALERFRELGDQIGTATTLTNLGRIGVDQGEPARAITLHEEALGIFEEVGDRANATETLNNLGVALLAAGSPEAARHRHQAALRRAQQSGDRHEAARAHAGLAAVHAYWAGSGRADEINQAGEHAACAASIFHELGLPLPAPLVRLLEHVGNARFLQGRTAPLVSDC
jgi:tetratricopeptide (TPR) repeat protein